MLIFNKEYREKIKEQELAKKFSEKALRYARKVEKAYGYFNYNGYICTITTKYGRAIRATILNNDSYIDNFDSICTKDDYKEFKKEIDKTFDINLNYTEESFLNLFKDNGVHDIIKDRNADRYTLEHDQYNYVFAVKETDGKIWFRHGHGSSGAHGSCPFHFDNVDEKTIIEILNFIKYKKKKNN